MPNVAMKLLIVDDEPLTRTLLKQIFSQRGHEVKTAEDGFTALRTMREWMPEVLVSDLNMPGMSGFELLSVVRRRLAAIYVVATSGAYTGEELPAAIAADAFHAKGTGIKTLVEQVEVTSKVRPSALRGRSESAPIWTPRCEPVAEADSADGPVYAMISCPECLRAMPQVLDEDTRSDETRRKTVPRAVSPNVFEVECVYCETPVHFAIVQELNPATSQPFGMAKQ